MTAAQAFYEQLLDHFGQAVAEAFLAAVRDVAAAVDVDAFSRAIQANDLDAAVRALRLEPAAYGVFLDAIAEAYGEGGRAVVGALPQRDPGGQALLFRFDVRNTRAEQWLKTHSSDLVTEIIDDQRAAVRQALVAGMERGENPRSTALDLVGRLDKATGKREGGILGLTSVQEQYARSARTELESGDPALMKNYLDRGLRDKRLDGAVTRAIAAGKPPAADVIERATERYRGRLLKLRGEVIGRTEALASLNASGHEALRQAVDSGQVRADQVRRVWKSAADSRVRNSHRALNGETAGIDEDFHSPSGAVLRFPGDPKAPASERIACRCWVQPRIDFFANLT